MPDQPSGQDSSAEDELSYSAVYKLEKNKINYWETIWLVKPFMGWNHIVDFEFSDIDKFNNPWRRKNPRTNSKVSITMPKVRET